MHSVCTRSSSMQHSNLNTSYMLLSTVLLLVTGYWIARERTRTKAGLFKNTIMVMLMFCERVIMARTLSDLPSDAVPSSIVWREAKLKNHHVLVSRFVLQDVATRRDHPELSSTYSTYKLNVWYHTPHKS